MAGKSRASASDLAVKPYPIRVFKDRESDDWVAEVSDLPGCIGVGETREEALEAAEGFIEPWIEDALENEAAVPEPSERSEASGRFVARLPRSLHARLQELASEEGTSLNQVVVMLLSEGVAGRNLSTAFHDVAQDLCNTINALQKETPSFFWVSAEKGQKPERSVDWKDYRFLISQNVIDPAGIVAREDGPQLRS